MSVAALSQPSVRIASRRSTAVLGAGALAIALAGGYVVAEVTGGARLLPALLVAGAILAVLAWRYPLMPVVFLALAATLIEQFPITGDGTDQIPLFVSLSSALSLGGLYLTPIEVILAAFLLIALMRAVLRHEALLKRSALVGLMMALLALVLFAEVRGLSRGGTVVDSLWELRPWLYLFLAFLVAGATIRDRRGLTVLLWCFVIGTGLKGLQGTVRYLQLRNVVPRPEAILAHEEAFFFGLFVVLAIGLWVFGVRGRLRSVATTLVPFVLIADLGNSRRTAWLILVAGIVVLWLLAWVRLPAQRRALVKVAVVGLIASVGYMAVFWNNYGVLGQPARAFRSAVVPSSRDKQSDQYRTLENANLSLNIRRSAPLGAGFGVPIDYAIPIIDLSNLTRLIKFVPHNGVLYVWMRLGFAGAAIFWWLIAAAIFAAGRVLRIGDLHVALFGGFVVCAIVGYLIQGTYDYGLFWFRMAIFVGLLLGAVQGILSGDLASRRAIATAPGLRREK